MKEVKLTKAQERLLQRQWSSGADASGLNVIAKIFNPYGNQTWYLVSQDPDHPDTLYGFADLGMGFPEWGYMSLKELQDIRISVLNTKLPLEVDKYFDPANAAKVWEKVSSGGYYADGGEIEVTLIDPSDYSKDRYKAIYADFDKDGISNADDASPLNAEIKTFVEPEVRMTAVMDELLQTKKDMDTAMMKFIEDLRKIAPKDSKIYARTKTPYSALRKVVRQKLASTKKLDNEVEGLTDLVGTMIVVKDQAEVERMRNVMDKDKKLGEIIERKDYYAKPKDGYRAVHYIFLYPYAKGKEAAVEVQIKTVRQKKLGEASHHAYKDDVLNRDRMLELSTLAAQADSGNIAAQKEFDRLFKNPRKVELSLRTRKIA